MYGADWGKFIQSAILFGLLAGGGVVCAAAGVGACALAVILYCGGCLICPDNTAHDNTYNTDGVVAIEMQEKDVAGKDSDLADQV